MIINICFASDNNYIQHLGVALTSILKNANSKDKYNIYILEDNISERNKSKLYKLKEIMDFNLQFVKVNAEDYKICPRRDFLKYITLPTYYRLKISSLLPETEKVLYLDCDVIVNSDIKELYSIDIENNYIAGIPETGNDFHKKRLNIEGNDYYINAGVLLINCKKWRESNLEEKLFEYIKHPLHEIVFQDQDVINEVLKYKIKYIPLSWNFQHKTILEENSYIYHREEREIAIKFPKLIHFNDRNKPWNASCVNPYKKLYYKYLKMTPWKNEYYRIRIKTILKKISKEIFSISNEKEYILYRFFGLRIKKEIK